jgi:Flp pilus assembly protein TadD
MNRFILLCALTLPSVGLAGEPPTRGQTLSQGVGRLAARARQEWAKQQFAAAQQSARELCQGAPNQGSSWALLGDICLEFGEFEEAQRAYEEMLRIEGATAGGLPRLARLDVIHGRIESARKRLAEALRLAEAQSAPEAAVVAGLELELGEMAFRGGDWEGAEKLYTKAKEKLPESLEVREHLAELRGAQGRTKEAVALYEEVVTKATRAEWFQAMGDLYQSSGEPNEAQPWHDHAVSLYLKEAREGRDFLALARFYSDSQENPAQAVDWARKALEQRHGIEIWDALAWALYKNQQGAEAGVAITKALATGTKDAHLLYHAGMIRLSIGDVAGGKKALREALEINPRSNSFHVHRR